VALVALKVIIIISSQEESHLPGEITILNTSSQIIGIAISFYVNIHAKRNFDLGKKNKLLVGLDLGLNENLDSEISYTEIHTIHKNALIPIC